jgi:hypothetical protein
MTRRIISTIQERALASLRFMGDAVFTTVEEICDVLLRKATRSA